MKRSHGPWAAIVVLITFGLTGCGGAKTDPADPDAGANASSSTPSAANKPVATVAVSGNGKSDLTGGNAGSDNATGEKPPEPDPELYPKGADGLNSEVRDPALPPDPVLPGK